MTFAIDFGTSNTVVARWNAATQSAETLALADLSQRQAGNPPLIPSLVYVEQPTTGQVVAGQAVRDRGLDIASDPRFFRNFKRGIGTPLQGFLPEIEGQQISFEQVGRWYLERLLGEAKANLGELESLILTVPVASFETYRHWLGQICSELAISQVRLLDEPTAAALGYGLSGGQTLLVIDFGGGTLDLSLVRLELPVDRKPLGFVLKWGNRSLADSSAQKPQMARVLAKAGESLGGADIDNWLADHFSAAQTAAVSPLTLRLAERLKIALSTQSQASEVYFNDETFETLEFRLDRAEFEAILQQNQFFERLDLRLSQVLQQSQRQGIAPEDIDAVLLVGGTGQIPAVQRWLQSYFAAEKIRCDRPFEAIAHGALQLQQGVILSDFLYHSYGIRYWDRRNQRHGWHPIVKQGQPYPMTEPIELTLGGIG